MKSLQVICRNIKIRMIVNATKDKLNSTSLEYPFKLPIKTWKWYILWKSEVQKSLTNCPDCMNPLAVKQTGEDLSQDWMFHEMLPFKYVLAFELNFCCTCTVRTDNGCRFIHLCFSDLCYHGVLSMIDHPPVVNGL